MGFAHSDQPEKKVALLVASDLLQLAKETKKNLTIIGTIHCAESYEYWRSNGESTSSPFITLT